MSYSKLNLILLFFFITIDLAFLTSRLSATALIGLFDGFKLVIIIFILSLTIFPLHLLGRNGLIGAIESFFEFKLNIGPCTDRL